jgi:putative oxidoreductase
MSLYNGTRNFYERIILFGEKLQPWLLLTLRLYWGWSFLWAGWGKIHSIEKVTRFFTSLNIPFPEFHAHLVGYVELVGGALLMAGFAARFAAIPLAITMIVALCTAHSGALPGIISDQKGFISQTPVSYLMTSLIVLAFGPGGISLDGFFKRFVFKG